MRKPLISIVSNLVWLKEKGGTPWVVTAIQGSSAIGSCAHEPESHRIGIVLDDNLWIDSYIVCCSDVSYLLVIEAVNRCN